MAAPHHHLRLSHERRLGAVHRCLLQPRPAAEIVDTDACIAMGNTIPPGPQGTGKVVTVGDMDLYVAGEGPRAIVLVYDIMGFAPANTQHNCDVLAAAGFLVVMPDFFRGSGRGQEGFERPDSDVVDAELSYLHGLVELMAETSEDLLALLFGSAASNYGADGVKRSDGLPEWDAQSPRNRCTVARLLLDRARGGDVVAHRFAEQHKEALREMLARHPSIQVETRHGTKSVGALRERIEAAEAEAEAEEEEEARRAEEAAEAAAAEAAAAAAAAAANPTVTPLVGGGRARSQTTSAMADFFASRPPPSVANRRASDASGMAAMHRQPSQGSKAAGMAKTGQTPPAPPPPVRQFSGHI